MKRINSFGPLGFLLRIKLLLLLSLALGNKLSAIPRHAEDVLNRKISLVVEQQEVRSILNEISKLAEIKFVYSAQRIPCRKKVSIQAQDERLGDVLNSLLEPLDVLYYVSGNQIVLTKKPDDESVLIGIKSLSDDKKELTPISFFKTVTGKIRNDKGDPLEGASVTVKGTTRGTTTNASGVFNIEAEVGETLDISMIGYQPYSVQVGTSNAISVELTPLISSINEVVVVGYGTQKRASVTGAVSSVPGKTLNELPVVSIPQALQGRVPGVQVTNNGSPGTQPIVRIRGISSISYASDPLYVVDGFPTGDLSSIDMRDVESVDVLKDASAAAIYGSRATNGIIMITTKKGRRDDKLHVSLDTYVGTEKVTERLDLLSTDQYLTYERALNGAAGIAKPGRLETANFNQPIYNGTSQTYAQTNTDWQDAYFKDGLITQTSLGLSGGNSVSRFYASTGYFYQDGTSPSVSFKRYNFRLNSDHQISKVFTFGENLYTAFTDQGYDKNEQGARTNLVNVIRQLPYMPVYDPTTTSGYRSANNSFDGSDPTNPLLDANVRNHGTRSTVKVLGTAYLEINFAKFLKFRSTFGIDYSNGLDYSFSPIFESGGTVAGSSATVATVTNNRSISTVKLYTEQLTFDKTFGSHHINATAVYEQQEQTVRFENASGNQSSNSIQVLLNASNVAVATQKDGNYIASIIGRVNYDYQGKYLLSVAARRDGSSVWAPEKKWANFPSASVGWRLDQEDFMKGLKNLSELKLRVGYGITGLNAAVLGTNHPWQVNVDANSAIYPFNNTNAGSATTFGSSINRLGNKDLEWETTKQLNIGVDAGFFNNKLTLSAEYFSRNTDNLILNVPIPPSFGYTTTSVPINIAEMENNGFELQAGYNQRGKEFNWNIMGNLSVITNNVNSLAPSVPSIESGANQDFGTYNITRTETGHPIQSFYGWLVDGIFQTAAEVSSSPFQTAGTKPGDLKFRDINKDNKIDENDRVFIGSYLPKFTYSLNFGGNYKNFDLSLFFQGVQGNDIFNASRIISEGMVRLFGSSTEVLKAWSATNTGSTIPRAVSGDPNQNARPSPRWIEDGSFLRLKNIMLGYVIPGKTLQNTTKGVISSFRVYVSAQNLFTITNYKGYDPEVGNRTPGTSLTNGIDYAVYPQPHSYLIGIQVGF